MQYNFRLKIATACILAAGLLMESSLSTACTRVLYAPAGHPVMVGRNMDWVEDMRAKLLVYPRGIVRNGGDRDNALNWTAKYGSIVATAYDIATVDGMNEKGLSAQVNGLKISDYGTRDKSVPALSLVQWVQFYLDNFATVDEAVRFTEQTKFQMLPFYLPRLNKKIGLHLAIEDASGDSAIIEYLDGTPTIYHGRDYKVMTNDPAFSWQLENLKQYQGFGGDKPLPGTTLPQDRFVRAAFYVDHLPEPKSVQEEVTEVFSIMHNAEQPYGVASPERQEVGYSIWRVVRDLSNRVYYFNSLLSFNTVWARLDQFDLSAGAPVMKLDLVKYPNLSGDVTDQFKPVS